MNKISKEVIDRLKECFPKMFINGLNEAIIEPRHNCFFRLEDCETEEDVIKKIIWWLSRAAHKNDSLGVRRYLLNGINNFLCEEFTREDMARIYSDLGNGVDKELTQKFINQGYNMKLLKELPDHIKPYYQGE